MKVFIKSESLTEAELQNYVKNAVVKLTINGVYQGKVDLCKLLSECGRSVFAPVYGDKENKKNLKIKGYCELIIVPPSDDKRKASEKDENERG